MKKTINRFAKDTMISRHNVKMVVGGIRRRGCGNAPLFLFSLKTYPLGHVDIVSGSFYRPI